MSAPLPLLPVVGVGSYASPGWFVLARQRLREGVFGADDAAELFEDATRLAIADQLEAGLDVITDGEIARQRFVFEMFGRLGGLERVEARRKLGIPGYDTAPRFRVVGPLTAPNGLGVVAELATLARLAPNARLKVAVPGPLTFAAYFDANGHAPERIVSDLVAIVRRELEALVAAGAAYVQLDEPGWCERPFGRPLEAGLAPINAVLQGLRAHRAIHVCFGNNAGRPLSDRRLAPLVDPMRGLDCEQLVLEFANREMAEIALLAPLAERYEIAAGVVDVKSFHLETPERVAERIDECLAHVPAERLWITADCGFSALPRGLARAKMRAMVAGAKLVRARLGGGRRA
jgi:5-methyltetrahydropteroyltriglutamate--homocysteine methyltransferase